jgi:hypothetical protein
MPATVGVWIDHRQALIVTATKRGQEIGLIVSHVEKHLERSGDSPLKGRYESMKVPADDSQLRAFTGHINVYYEAVIAALRGADSILILGPGEAKGELKKRLVRSRLGDRICGVEAADKMTLRQLAAKVREFFALLPPPTQAKPAKQAIRAH